MWRIITVSYLFPQMMFPCKVWNYWETSDQQGKVKNTLNRQIWKCAEMMTRKRKRRDFIAHYGWECLYTKVGCVWVTYHIFFVATPNKSWLFNDIWTPKETFRMFCLASWRYHQWKMDWAQTLPRLWWITFGRKCDKTSLCFRMQNENEL